MSDLQKLKVELCDLEHGWITVGLQRDKDDCCFRTEHVPYDVVNELAKGLNSIIEGETEAIARCHDGSLEYEIRFEEHGAQIEVKVQVTYQVLAEKSRDEIFTATGSRYEMLRPFWKAIRDLEGHFSTEEYKRRWREGFPTREVEVLTQRIKALKSTLP